MVDQIINGIVSALSKVGAGFFFGLSIFIIFLLGVVFLFSKRRKVIKYIFVFLTVFLFTLAVFLIEQKFTWTIKSSMLILILTEFLFFLSFGFKKEEKEDKKCISPTQFIKTLEDKIQTEKIKDDFECDTIDVGVPLGKENPEIKEGVNFTHVLNVIEKLNYFNLSREEKLQTNELKSMCLNYKPDGDGAEFRRKINDKLSFLLKIMSKYNV